MANITVTPQGNIYLCKTKLENDYKNQLTFSNATAQSNYFSSTVQHTYSNYTYVKKDNYIQVSDNIDSIIDCNYLYYRNVGFTNKIYYCFITRMEYVNENCTRIYFETDVYQTWLFQIQYTQSFVEREHVNDDTVGLHTVPEGLEMGDYVHAKQPGFLNNYESYWICIGVTELPPSFDQAIQSNRVFNGIYSGLIYLVFKTANDATNFIKGCDDAGKAGVINSLFMIPSSLCPNSSYIIGTIGNYSFEFTWIENSNNETTLAQLSTFDRPQYLDINYNPVNKKLLTYPFSYCYVTNNCGSDVIYKYEDFKNGNPKFRIIGSITPGCSIKCFPIDYKSMDDIATTSNSYNYGLNSGKFPICSWNSDVYTNWLTQQSVNMMLGDTRDYMSLATSVFTGNIGGAIGSFNSIIDRVAQKYQYSYTPNQAKGNTNSGDVTFSSNHMTFDIYFMSIKKEYAQIIDNYFSMFGYKINRVKVPNITGRTNWNYVKTINCNFEGDIPQTDLQIIKRIFDNGITLWHNPTTMLNYSNTNNIVT